MLQDRSITVGVKLTKHFEPAFSEKNAIQFYQQFPYCKYVLIICAYRICAQMLTKLIPRAEFTKKFGAEEL